MNTQETELHVWRDETSDPECPVWIVSRECDGGSQTLSLHDTQDAAEAAAESVAADTAEAVTTLTD